MSQDNNDNSNDSLNEYLDRTISQHEGENNSENNNNKQKNKNKFTVKTWSAFFAIPEEDSYDPSERSQLDESAWFLHLDTLELRSVKRRDGTFVFIPTGLETIVTKYPYTYADKQTNKWTADNTIVKFTKGLDMMYDPLTDPFISKFIPKDIPQYPSTRHGSKIPFMFGLGLEAGILPSPGVLFEQVKQSKIFSYNIQSLDNDPNKNLYYRAFVPSEELATEISNDGGALFPTTDERHYHRLLKETKDMLQKMQQLDEVKTANLIKSKKDLEEMDFSSKTLEDLR